MKGWIKLYRRIQDHWLYKERRKFSRFEAWIDLLLETNHKDNRFPLGNEIVECKRGQIITSIRQLCNRWDWSNTKVTNFLKLLQEDKMITYFSDNKKTVITIVNYDLYQSGGDTETYQERREDDAKATQKHTNKNVKNDKNVNKLYNSFFDTYNNQNIIKHKQLTPKMKQAINRALKKDRQEDILKAMGRYGQAFRDKEYPFCTYKMTLDKFLTQGNGYTDWLDEGQKWINYNDFKNRSLDQTTTQRQGEQKFKTKFHLANSRGDKYTAEELERIVLEGSKRRLEER